MDALGVLVVQVDRGDRDRRTVDYDASPDALVVLAPICGDAVGVERAVAARLQRASFTRGVGYGDVTTVDFDAGRRHVVLVGLPRDDVVSVELDDEVLVARYDGTALVAVEREALVAVIAPRSGGVGCLRALGIGGPVDCHVCQGDARREQDAGGHHGDSSPAEDTGTSAAGFLDAI